MIESLDRVLKSLSTAAAYLAAVALSVSVLVTVADIILRRAINLPVTGVVDITQLAVMWAAFCSIPVAFHMDNHISVVMLTNRIPVMARVRVYSVGTFICSLLLIGASFTAGVKGYQEYLQGDRSMILGIPLVWYWVPVVVGFALASACAFGRSLQYAFSTGAAAALSTQGAVDGH